MLRSLMLAGTALMAGPLLAQSTAGTTGTTPTDMTTTRAGQTGMTEVDAQDSDRNNMSAQSEGAMEQQQNPTGTTSVGTSTSTMTRNQSATTSGTSATKGAQGSAMQGQDMVAQHDIMANQNMTANQGAMLGMGGPLNIESNWGRFDEGGKGYLTPLEFGKWVMETNGQSTSAVDASKRSRKSNLPSVQVLNETASDLARIDANHDWRITRDELSSVAE